MVLGDAGTGRGRGDAEAGATAGHLGSLLATGMGADITFDVGGRAFRHWPGDFICEAARVRGSEDKGL